MRPPGLVRFLRPRQTQASDLQASDTAKHNRRLQAVFSGKILNGFFQVLVTGRNFAEILRVIDSLQLTARYGIGTPVNWQPGQDVIVLPAIPDGDLPARFPKGVKHIKSYLRITPQPDHEL